MSHYRGLQQISHSALAISQSNAEYDPKLTRNIFLDVILWLDG
jgi:hypothetical protein